MSELSETQRGEGFLRFLIVSLVFFRLRRAVQGLQGEEILEQDIRRVFARRRSVQQHRILISGRWRFRAKMTPFRSETSRSFAAGRPANSSGAECLDMYLGTGGGRSSFF